MIRIADEVGPAHPALAGHFPGNPIVPGALLLARVARAAAAAFGAGVAGAPAVKFLAPLRPGERFEVELEAAKALVKFRVLRGATLIAAGTLKLAQ
ncbi:MAG TPA: 3-hydroxyacyl-ACP dehydratase [Burkholderiales bacterium]|jgi:3-hydroxymyristoyl/3-hydroxydecanoyl-(acyl carrier protein) dehydratase|nr:3-hydroxyacyl-ACP dehydratase [Burkholderiales bacterium]